MPAPARRSESGGRRGPVRSPPPSRGKRLFLRRAGLRPLARSHPVLGTGHAAPGVLADPLAAALDASADPLRAALQPGAGAGHPLLHVATDRLRSAHDLRLEILSTLLDRHVDHSFRTDRTAEMR